MKTAVSIVIALVGALLLNYAMYVEKKALGVLPKIQARLTWSLIKAFLTNRTWMWAQAINWTGFAFYIVALATAPVSIVQPIMASGIALLAYLAIKHLGEKPRPVDFLGIGLNVLGVILVAVSLLTGAPKSNPNYTTFWIFAAAVVALAVIIPLTVGRKPGNRQGAALGISGGLLFGLAAVVTRLLALNWGKDWTSAAIFAICCVLTYVPAFIIFQAGLQRGMAVVVAPIYSGLVEFTPILIGMIALHESLPHNAFLAALRLIAFGLVLAGTIILSYRAEEAEEEMVLQPPEPHPSIADSPLGSNLEGEF
jgi:uncharacterized membrane protein